MTTDLQQKVQLLRQMGVPDAVIAQRVKGQFGVDIGSQASPSPVPAKPSGFLESLISPAKKYGAMLGEAANLGVYKLSGKDMSQYQPRFMTEEDLAKFETPGGAAKEGAKRIAGAASYLIPGGGTTGQLLTRGALSGALYGLSEDQDIAKSAAYGAGGAYVGGKVLPWVFRKVGDLFGSSGEKVATSLVQPKVAATPFAAEEEKAIVQGLRDLGIKGSPQAQREAMPEVFRQLSGQIDDLLTRSPETVKKGFIRKGIKSALSESINYDPSMPEYKQAAEKFINQVMKGAGGNEVDAKVLFKAKQNLGHQLSRAFTKIEKGNPLTSQEEVGVAIWGAIDDMLPQSVRSLTRMQSLLYKASPGLMKSAQKGVSLPMVGKLPSVVSEPLQTGVSTVGQGMLKAGEAGQKAAAGIQAPALKIAGAPPVAESAGRMAGASFGRAPSEVQMPVEMPSTQEAQPILSPGGQWQWNPQTNDWEPVQGAGQAGGMDQRAVAIAMLKNPKYASVIKGAYEMMRGPQLPAQEQAKVKEAGAGLRLVGVLENAFGELQKQGVTASGGGLGILQGMKGTAGSVLQSNPAAASYQRTVDAFLSRLSRASGEKGVLTDEDLQRIRRAIPDFYTSPAVAARNWQMIREIIGAAIEAKQSSSTIPESPSLMFGGGE